MYFILNVKTNHERTNWCLMNTNDDVTKIVTFKMVAVFKKDGSFDPIFILSKVPDAELGDVYEEPLPIVSYEPHTLRVLTADRSRDYEIITKDLTLKLGWVIMDCNMTGNRRHVSISEESNFTDAEFLREIILFLMKKRIMPFIDTTKLSD